MDILIETGNDDAQATVLVTGAMTIYEALEAKEALLAALRRTPDLRVDLSGVTELDAAGAQLLIMLRREASRCGSRLRFAFGSAAAEEALSRLNLCEFLAA